MQASGAQPWMMHFDARENVKKKLEWERDSIYTSMCSPTKPLTTLKPQNRRSMFSKLYKVCWLTEFEALRFWKKSVRFLPFLGHASAAAAAAVVAAVAAAGIQLERESEQQAGDLMHEWMTT